MNVAVTLLIMAGTGAGIGELGMVLGWLLTRCDHPAPHPWNWRVLAGPVSYFNWLDRRRA